MTINRLDNAHNWVNATELCRVLMVDQADMLHDFLALTCTSRMPAPYQNWCVQNDTYVPMWYNMWNRNSFELLFQRPSHIPDTIQIPPPKAVMPTRNDEHIVSRFIFLDESTGKMYTEYIEPLVSHLRFPLAGCISDPNALVFRGYIIPPPLLTLRKGTRKLYFDAGASSWSDGAGGPSLSYFYNMWLRHGIEFDEIHAFEMTTSLADFKATLPNFVKNRTFYQQCSVSSTPEKHSKKHPFVPLKIAEMSPPNSYVLFKLDIDSPSVENGQIDFILNDLNSSIIELAYEHHISGNIIMRPYWGILDKNVSLKDSYEMFLTLRQKGIRAHSWV